MESLYILLIPKQPAIFAIGSDNQARSQGAGGRRDNLAPNHEMEIHTESMEDADGWIDILKTQVLRCRGGNSGAKGVLRLEEYMATQHRVMRGTLHSACLLGESKLVAQLLKDGADANLLDKVGACPLHLCALGGSEAATRLVLDQGGATSIAARDTKYGLTPLHVCVLLGHTALVQLLAGLGGKAREVPNEGGHTPLYVAADHNKAEAVKALLEAGCDANRREKQRGFTPLHIAAFKGSAAAAHELLRATPGAARIPDVHNGGTALHWAVIAGKYDVANLLVNAGAQPNSRDNKNQTPLHLIRPDNKASWELRDRFVALFAEHGARDGVKEAAAFTTEKQELPLHTMPAETVAIFNKHTPNFKVKKQQGPPNKLPQPADWVDDKERTDCMICATAFSFFGRKHHCRKCGWLVCGTCSSNKVSSAGKDERVCDGCFNNMCSKIDSLRHSGMISPQEREGMSGGAAGGGKSLARKEAEIRAAGIHGGPEAEEAARAELFAGGSMAPASRHDETRGAAGKTKNIMGDNLKKAAERGDQINRIADRSAEMADASKSFAANARALREREEKKGFFGFF